jgi:hypothetical protein
MCTRRRDSTANKKRAGQLRVLEVMDISVKTVELYLTRGAKLLRERYREVFPAE